MKLGKLSGNFYLCCGATKCVCGKFERSAKKYPCPTFMMLFRKLSSKVDTLVEQQRQTITLLESKRTASPVAMKEYYGSIIDHN